MDSSIVQLVKVSISARLISFSAYFFPAIGGAVSSLSLIGLLQALRQNESAGIGVVTGTMAEATYPVLISLYIGAFLGLAVITCLIIRMFMQTQKASPSSWFFLLAGILCLAPAVFFAEAESLIIEVLVNPRTSSGIVAVASNISLFSILSIFSTVVIFIILFVLSVLPFSTRSRPRWSPLIAALLIEILIFGFAIFFHLRLLWLNKLFYDYR